MGCGLYIFRNWVIVNSVLFHLYIYKLMLKDFLKDNTESILLQIETEDLTITDKKSGRSLLQIAVMNENIDVVKALLK